MGFRSLLCGEGDGVYGRRADCMYGIISLGGGGGCSPWGVFLGGFVGGKVHGGGGELRWVILSNI